MSGLVDYGSDSSSEEEEQWQEQKQQRDGVKANESESLASKLPPPKSRGGGGGHKEAVVVDEKKQKLRQALEAKRRQMFALPDLNALKDDDEDEEEAARAAAPAPKKPKGFSELLPQPKNRPRQAQKVQAPNKATSGQQSTLSSATSLQPRQLKRRPPSSQASHKTLPSKSASAAASSSSARAPAARFAGIPRPARDGGQQGTGGSRFGLVSVQDDDDDDDDDGDDGLADRGQQSMIAQVGRTAAPYTAMTAAPPPPYHAHAEYGAAPVPAAKPKFGYGRPPQMQQQQQQHMHHLQAGSTTVQNSDEQEEELKRFFGRREVPGNIKLVEVDDNKRRDTFDEWQAKHRDTDTTSMPSTTANVPKGMERRKHQITFLAAEAQAREQELKAKWAQSATARRAAKQRYGF